MSNTSIIHTGKIKFYNEEKGFGFIIDEDDPDEEYFFNKTQAFNAGIGPKDKGASVSYSLEYDKENHRYKVINLEM